MEWNLDYFYKDTNEFTNEYESVKNDLSKLSSFKGKLNNLENISSYLEENENIIRKIVRIYQYAMLKSDLNLKDTKLLSLKEKAVSLYSDYVNTTSFFNPEILKLDYKTLESFAKSNKLINEYLFTFKNLFDLQKHVLSEDKEELLSNFSNVLSSSKRNYTSLATSDRTNKTIKINNEKVEVTMGNFTTLIKEAKTAKDRKNIFEAIYSYYDDNKNTFASIYSNIMHNYKAIQKSRGYSSILESFLDQNQIPIKVYETLIFTAKKSSSSVKEYIKLKKKYLKLKKYYTYDRFISLAESNKKYEYEEAKKIFFASISNMPKEFQDFAKQSLKDGFVDVLEKPGKRTGAYSSSGIKTNPFILLNYDKSLNDVFTLAHEAGHSTHTLFSDKYQPIATAEYTIFVAEIASTFNELLLLDKLLEEAKTKDEKIVLIETELNNIMATFFRQSLFAYYEYEVAKLLENNEPITEEILSNIMIKLYKDFYGLNITKEKYKKYVWAYIPHLFQSPFYVYQYATSFSASLKIYQDIKNNVPNALENYIELLKSGGSDYPVNLVKKAGADLTKKETFIAVKNRFDYLLTLLKETLES